MLLKARYVVPVDGPAIENGAVVVERGLITAVGSARKLHALPITDYGDAVICPGFVNAHTHLELSLLAGRVRPGPDFVRWLRQLTAASGDFAQSPGSLQKRNAACGATSPDPTGPERVRQAVRAGLTQSLASGVTLVGDIARAPQWAREVLARSPLRGVSFGEVIAVGTRRHLLAERLDAAASTQWESKSLRVGISPHAPYTVEPDAMRACADRARARNAPLCIHLAETPHEDRFTRCCEGPFVDFLRGLSVWDESMKPSGWGPVELAKRTGVLGERTVVAHANYVGDDDIRILAETGVSVAYCPRTHRAFGHPPHCFRDMLAAGVNVCIGTDSLASSPTLSVLDELRFLRREHRDLRAVDILAMGTLRGAGALGFEKTGGSLSVGKAADLVVIPLDRSASRSGWEAILESPQPPLAVHVTGRLLSDLLPYA